MKQVREKVIVVKPQETHPTNELNKLLIEGWMIESTLQPNFVSGGGKDYPAYGSYCFILKKLIDVEGETSKQ